MKNTRPGEEVNKIYFSLKFKQLISSGFNASVEILSVIFLIYLSAFIDTLSGIFILFFLGSLHSFWAFMWFLYIYRRECWVSDEAFYCTGYRAPIKFCEIKEMRKLPFGMVRIKFQKKREYFSLFFPALFRVKKVNLNMFQSYETDFLKLVMNKYIAYKDKN